MFAFFPADNLCYLVNHKILTGINTGPYGLFASRCWFAYCIFDIAGTLYQIQKLNEEDHPSEEARRKLFLKLVGNTADLLESYNLSVSDNRKFLGPLTMPLCDVVAALVSITLNWPSTK
eukprot:TRINITY_DN18518_c0_g1_i4.p1 TRINITY_DN18518_c0_g1~~TRINITY_DN18518_c0_g1_i4.p1  ORF type:complete len:119 (-),score=10.70 TRINITY_DN18518_c0_g1_i4:78-434(-)